MCIRLNGEAGEGFGILRGVRQECIDLYMDGVIRQMN